MSKIFLIILFISSSAFYSCNKCKNCKTVLTNTETGAVLSETKSEKFCNEDLKDIEKEKPVIYGIERTETICE